MVDLYVTPEMVTAAYARQHQLAEHEEHMALWHVAREEKSPRDRKKPLVIDLDGPLHTPEQPICPEETCICADAEFSQMQRTASTSTARRNRPLISTNFEDRGLRGTLNGNRGFRILR